MIRRQMTMTSKDLKKFNEPVDENSLVYKVAQKWLKDQDAKKDSSN